RALGRDQYRPLAEGVGQPGKLVIAERQPIEHEERPPSTEERARRLGSYRDRHVASVIIVVQLAQNLAQVFRLGHTVEVDRAMGERRSEGQTGGSAQQE